MKLCVVLMLLSSVALADELCDVSTGGSTTRLKAGEKGVLVVAFTLQEGAHVSDEAPLKLALSGDKVALEKTALTLADSVAKKQGAQKYAVPRFEVGFVPAAGAKVVDAKLSFFVCTATQCQRQTRTLSVPLEVL